MRFPYLREAAPDVLATAWSQRWDPADIGMLSCGQAAAEAFYRLTTPPTNAAR